MLAVVALVVFVGVGGNITLLVQETRGRIRTRGWNSKLLRALSGLSAAVIVGTAFVARPWYWDLALAVVAAAGFAGVTTLLRALWRAQPPPSTIRVVGLATSAVLTGVVLLGLGGVAAVLDVASLTSATPVLGYHGGGQLSSPELYMVFWGPEWGRGDPPALRDAVAFEQALPGSAWGAAVTSAGFGVSGFRDGGCWIDPTAPAAGTTVTGAGSPPFGREVAAAFGRRHDLRSCPGTQSSTVPAALPADAVVALWLPATVPFESGGVAEHGYIDWPGHPGGLVVAGLPGGYAFWGLPKCAKKPVCAGLPGYAKPTYALSHELLEAATNPYGGGWYAPGPLSWTARYVLRNGPPSLFGITGRPSYPGEVADLCEPGAQLVHGHMLVGRLDPSRPLPVTAFYEPGHGCVTP